MSGIETIFRPGHKALIAYLTVGYPSLELTERAVTVLAENGGDLIELGIPFSDPLADGATIQKASHQALRDGVTPEVCLNTARRIHDRAGIPLVFMTYYNPVLHFGLDQFCRSARDSGAGGLIVPDLPPEEGGSLEKAARQNSLHLIYLLAPTSSEQRIQLVARKSRGFIYLVSVAGVTGARQSLAGDLEAFVSRVRRVTGKPLCVGFGISNAEQARQVAAMADGVIIGSRLIQLIEEDAMLSSLARFTREMRRALDNGQG